MRYIRGFLIKKAPILWLRNRTTENRKGKKARNIKEKRQSKNFNTVSKQLDARLSSLRDNLSVAGQVISNSILQPSREFFWEGFCVCLLFEK